MPVLPAVPTIVARVAPPGVGVTTTPAGRAGLLAMERLAVGAPATAKVIAPGWPATNAPPVVTRAGAGRVPVRLPAGSHADCSPPYDSSVAPLIVVPAG